MTYLLCRYEMTKLALNELARVSSSAIAAQYELIHLFCLSANSESFLKSPEGENNSFFFKSYRPSKQPTKEGKGLLEVSMLVQMVQINQSILELKKSTVASA